MRAAIWLLCCVLLVGCGSVEVEHYAGESPRLDLPGYFSRPVQAWGMFQNRSGEVVKRFKVDITSHREGDRLILDERFLYSDGTRQQRIWSLVPAGEGRWRGRAADVVGEAQGEVAGNALRWRYQLRLDVDGTTWDVDMDDWMYLMDENTLINRSRMSKLGVELGQVTLFFRRDSAQ
jgi:hypothetical protein